MSKTGFDMLALNRDTGSSTGEEFVQLKNQNAETAQSEINLRSDIKLITKQRPIFRGFPHSRRDCLPLFLYGFIVQSE